MDKTRAARFLGPLDGKELPMSQIVSHYNQMFEQYADYIPMDTSALLEVSELLSAGWLKSTGGFASDLNPVLRVEIPAEFKTAKSEPEPAEPEIHLEPESDDDFYFESRG